MNRAEFNRRYDGLNVEPDMMVPVGVPGDGCDFCRDRIAHSWDDHDAFGEYVICYRRRGKFDGNFGTFPDRESAEFFDWSSAHGGRPERTSRIITVAEFRKTNESRPPVISSDDESGTEGQPRSANDVNETPTRRG